MVITFRRGGSLSIWHMTFFLPYFLHFQQVYWVYPVVLKQVFRIFFFSPNPRCLQVWIGRVLFWGLLLMPKTKHSRGSDRHCYLWNLSKPKVTLGNPSGIFSVFSKTVEPTICIIHTWISSLIMRAGLGRTTSVSTALSQDSYCSF